MNAAPCTRWQAVQSMGFAMLFGLSVGSASCGLDQETLDRLDIDPGSVSVQPGDEVQFRIGTWECCSWLDEVAVYTKWHVDPDYRVSIGKHSGLLEVHEDAPPGWRYTVVADVGSGSRILTAQVTVYTPESNPFARFWTETGQIDCVTGEVLEPQHPIREIVFEADGRFSVTWNPFESYKDYWGEYAFDLAAGTILISPTDGNHLPGDFQGSGSFVFEGADQVLLNGVWFGTDYFEEGPVHCGHRLER